jgi:hypothetical protein
MRVRDLMTRRLVIADKHESSVRPPSSMSWTPFQPDRDNSGLRRLTRATPTLMRIHHGERLGSASSLATRGHSSGGSLLSRPMATSGLAL